MIEKFIPTGDGIRVTRQELAALSGMKDRDIRREIERLRNNGIPIMSDSTKPGYWVADTQAEKVKTVRELRSRAFKLLKTAKIIEKTMAGQIKFTE